MYQVRKAEEKDMDKIMDLLDQVAEVHHVGRPDLFKANATKYTRQELLSILEDETRPVFVYVDEAGNVRGHAFCMHQEASGNHVLVDHKTLYIDDICVDQAARGMHVGSAIYEFVENYAKECGCYNVTLNVWSTNVSAMKFYEAMGMKPQKVGMEKVL